MAAMLSGIVVIAAFGLVAAAGLILIVSLYRITARAAAGPDGEAGRAGPEGG